MEMQNVVQLFPNQQSDEKMTHMEAMNLLNLITTISRKTKQEINVLNSQAGYFKGQAIKTAELQNKINSLIQKWSDKMQKLGVAPLSMFKIRFDLKEGIFFWEFPEMKLYQEN
jgi:hypothetical protein